MSSGEHYKHPIKKLSEMINMKQPTNLLNQLSTQIVERENQKAEFERTYATQSKEITRLSKFLHAEILETSDENKGLSAIAEAIETGRYGKVDHIGILNFNTDDRPVIVKVYSDKSETFPIPLIVIFNGNISSIGVITELQLYCGHENDTWSIAFED